MVQRSGFIYLWYDRKHRRFYIGCHWGKETDGYICSSDWMRRSFKRRPNDFKRRIIQRNIPRDKLLDEEFKWLSLIPEEQLGKRYYNLRKHRYGHWSNNPSSKLSVGEKITRTQTGKKRGPMSEHQRQAISKAKKGKPMTPAQIIAAEKLAEYSRNNPQRHWLGKKRDNISEQRAAIWQITFPDGHKEIIKNLTRFCRENMLSTSCLCDQGYTKGYRATRV